MRQHLQGIDHVVVLVRDLDKAQQAYARMGFTLTPRGFHTLGSQNHCLMFGGDYVELLAVPRQHPAMQYFSDFLAKADIERIAADQKPKPQPQDPKHE